jgi:hypothetical protein
MLPIFGAVVESRKIFARLSSYVVYCLALDLQIVIAVRAVFSFESLF